MGMFMGVDNVVCRYCKKEVDIDFEEQKDRRKRTYWRAKCPSCGKLNVKYPKKEEPEVPSEEEEEEVSEEEVIEEPEVPSEEEEEEEPEAPSKEEEEPEDKKDKPLPIALIICVSIILILIIINIWLFSKYLEYEKKKEELQHGDKEGQMGRDR